MVVGSLASSYHGDPRTTHDIDLVILPSKQALDGFVRDLDVAQFYVRARERITSHFRAQIWVRFGRSD
jgi:hypothetical protein